MSSLFLSFTSHSRPFPKLPVTFFELRLPPAPPTALPSPPHPPKPPDPPDPQICFFSVRLFVSMALSLESSGGLMLIVECPITAVCRLSPSLVQIWGLMLTVPLSRFSRNSSPLLVEMLPPFTTLSLPHIVPLRSLGFVPMVLPLCLLHPSLESIASESLGVNFPWLTALCSFCCQIRFERISLRFASDSLLICLSFTKFSWSSRTGIKKDLTSYVCWKVEPCNLNPFIWKSVMEFGVILAGVLILSDHLNGDSDLPCIEVLVRHVLILCVAKGFVPKISICVYVFVDAQWEVPPAEAPNPIPSPPQSATRCFVDAAWISNGNCGAALFAETLAMKLAFADAQTAGFHTLNVSSDCKALISLLNSGTSTVDLRSLLHDIRELSVSFTSICFIFIPRLDNVCAVNLAKSTLLDVSSSSASGG